MKQSKSLWAFMIVIALLLLAGCAGAEYAATQYEAAGADYEMRVAEEAPPVEMAEPESASPPADDVSVSEIETGRSGDMALKSVGQRVGRLIIKDAAISLLVADTDTAIDRTTQIVDDVDGYIISSRVWYQEWGEESYKYSTITIGVPVDQFETALRRLRDIALRVTNESASGEDVTDQYVDLESQLKNLQATRDRIMTFLDRAQTVEEALVVNEELSNIEGQIEEIQGRMNYLKDRSAYSTIAITIEPDLPDIVPTPTLTPTATSTPTPTATIIPWTSSKTVEQAKRALTDTYHGLFEAAIWIVVLIVPVLGPPALIVFLIWYWNKKRSSKEEATE